MSVLILTVILAACLDYSVGITECLSLNNAYNERFELLYDWNYINFTWPNPKVYQKAISSGFYIPENNAIVGVKYYDDKLYLALPKSKPGTPVTLAWVEQTPVTLTVRNPLLNPFPSWQMNVASNCDGLQNVQSMEIDRKGIMWVLDGRRIDETNHKCPPKIVLLDIKSGGRVIQTYKLPNEICSHDSCFLNDIVLEEFEGGFAYITDTSDDPGLIVFSRQFNRAWKVRDPTMFAQAEAVNFSVHGFVHSHMTPIDGIALSPVACLDDPDRRVYYSALTGLNVYSISTKVLRNEQLSTSMSIHRYIRDEGPKPGPSDGLMMDSTGFLYFGLLTDSAVAKWNIKAPINTSQVVDQNSDTIVWPDSFGFDTFGTLYLVANNIDYFMQHNASRDNINFRLLKLYTGTCSYQF